MLAYTVPAVFDQLRIEAIKTRLQGPFFLSQHIMEYDAEIFPRCLFELHCPKDAE
jgi:hypothetical protein